MRGVLFKFLRLSMIVKHAGRLAGDRRTRINPVDGWPECFQKRTQQRIVRATQDDVLTFWMLEKPGVQMVKQSVLDGLTVGLLLRFFS